jgi:hypothetical protein
MTSLEASERQLNVPNKFAYYQEVPANIQQVLTTLRCLDLECRQTDLHLLYYTSQL